MKNPSVFCDASCVGLVELREKKAASGDVSALISNIIIVIDVLLLEMFL